MIAGSFLIIRNRNKVDANATAFLQVTGITDPVISSAINTLCIQLKQAGLWDSMRALYPFVGGTANTHKFNLINPQDTNAAFRLVFFGGWTHSATGAKPNGTNGYADTFLNNSTQLQQNNNSFSVYLRTNYTAGAACDLGIYTAGNYGNAIYGNDGSSRNSFFNSSRNILISNTTSLRFLACSRIASNNMIAEGNNTQQNNTQNSVNHQNISWNLGRLAGFAGDYSPREQAFTHIGFGLSSAQITTLKNIVTTFQTTLGRQV
jgi:hypothetical protein